MPVAPATVQFHPSPILIKQAIDGALDLSGLTLGYMGVGYGG